MKIQISAVEEAMVFTQQYMLQTIATDNFNQVGAVVYV
jgi:hypothetical protein